MVASASPIDDVSTPLRGSRVVLYLFYCLRGVFVKFLLVVQMERSTMSELVQTVEESR